jgi:hypothetical protein
VATSLLLHRFYIMMCWVGKFGIWQDRLALLTIGYQCTKSYRRNIGSLQHNRINFLWCPSIHRLPDMLYTQLDQSKFCRNHRRLSNWWLIQLQWSVLSSQNPSLHMHSLLSRIRLASDKQDKQLSEYLYLQVWHKGWQPMLNRWSTWTLVPRKIIVKSIGADTCFIF